MNIEYRYLLEPYYPNKMRKREALEEVKMFLFDSERDVLLIEMKFYHANIQSFGLRHAILDEFPKLTVLDYGTYLYVIKTNVDNILKDKKNKYNSLVKENEKIISKKRIERMNTLIEQK